MRIWILTNQSSYQDCTRLPVSMSALIPPNYLVHICSLFISYKEPSNTGCRLHSHRGEKSCSWLTMIDR